MPLKSDYNHIICIMEGETKNIRFVLKIYRFVLRLLNISFCGLYIRPRIESTQQGQEALKKHLSLMQRLRKEVAQAEEQKSAMLNDYMTNHSEKTWQEYIAWYNKTHKGETKK